MISRETWNERNDQIFRNKETSVMRADELLD
jgi:hypothetical protein